MNRSAAEGRLRIAAWLGVALIAGVPILLAAVSPLQRGREALWTIGGMAGVMALSLLLIQPLLMTTSLRLLAPAIGRRWHRSVGLAIMAMVILHVGALYVYSPDDVSDALLLVSPTPFSLYGVIGLGCLAATAVLAATRGRLPLSPRMWRAFHSLLAVAIVGSGAVHALMIDGAMEERSKLVVCLAAVASVLAGAWQVNMRPRLSHKSPASKA